MRPRGIKTSLLSLWVFVADWQHSTPVSLYAYCQLFQFHSLLMEVTRRVDIIVILILMYLIVPVGKLIKTFIAVERLCLQNAV